MATGQDEGATGGGELPPPDPAPSMGASDSWVLGSKDGGQTSPQTGPFMVWALRGAAPLTFSSAPSPTQTLLYVFVCLFLSGGGSLLPHSPCSGNVHFPAGFLGVTLTWIRWEQPCRMPLFIF